MITVTALNTNYSEIPTGEIEMTLAQFVSKHDLREENGVYVAEWGSDGQGEDLDGRDTFEITVTE